MDVTENTPTQQTFVRQMTDICNTSHFDKTTCLLNFKNDSVFLEKTNEVVSSYLERALGFLIIGIIGIVANMFVIFVLGTSVKIQQKLVNTLIIHQSFVDLLASISLVGTAHLDGLDKHGLIGIHADIYCFFVAPKWPLWVLMFISSFSLMFLNIERYISIVYPMYHHTNVTRKKVLMSLPIVWVLGSLEDSFIASTFVASEGACNIGTTHYHLRMIWITLIAYILLHFFLPLLLVLYIYGHMFIRVRFSVNSRDAKASVKRNNVMEKAKSNIFKTMLLITICYAICYAFNCIYIALFLPGIIPNVTGK